MAATQKGQRQTQEFTEYTGVFGRFYSQQVVRVSGLDIKASTEDFIQNHSQLTLSWTVQTYSDILSTFYMVY